MLRNIIGIYPCYMGGHHFANMISTDAQFTSRISDSSYDQIEINAHINDMNLGQLHPKMVDYVEKNIEMYASQSNVFSSHLGGFIEFKYRGLLDRFPNKKYYLIEFPKNPELDMLFRKRAWLHRDMAYYNYGYYYNEFKSHHRYEAIEAIVGEPVLRVPSDIIFCEDSLEYVSLLNHVLNLNLEYEKIQPIHQKWFAKVLDVVKNLPEPPMSSDIIVGKN